MLKVTLARSGGRRRQGLEQPRESAGNLHDAVDGDAKSDARNVNSAHLPHDLGFIINHWHTLPIEIRQAIIALVQSAAKK